MTISAAAAAGRGSDTSKKFAASRIASRFKGRAQRKRVRQEPRGKNTEQLRRGDAVERAARESQAEQRGLARATSCLRVDEP